MSGLPRSSELSAAQGAGDARWVGPEPVPPPLPPAAASSAAAALSGSRIRSFPPSGRAGEKGRLACHVAAWLHALIGWCSRQAPRHTRPVSPRPEGCGPRSSSGPAPGARPAALCRPGVGSHTVRTPATATLEFLRSRPLLELGKTKRRLAGAELPLKKNRRRSRGRKGKGGRSGRGKYHLLQREKKIRNWGR